MLVLAPTNHATYVVDWAVNDQALVAAGALLGWLCPEEHCALVPVVAPCAGVVTRRSPLLPRVAKGAVLASVGGDPAELRAAEAPLLAARKASVERELRELAARKAPSSPVVALIEAEERALGEWLRAYERAARSGP